MKAWYIILADSETACEFVSVLPYTKTVTLKWPTGALVKLRLHDFKREYKEAVDGNEVLCYAVGSKNRSSGKPVKVVFK